ncbi:hypothetical protein GCM10027347_59780 [Larkinella harenae]
MLYGMGLVLAGLFLFLAGFRTGLEIRPNAAFHGYECTIKQSPDQIEKRVTCNRLTIKKDVEE